MEFQSREQGDNGKLLKAQSHIWNHTLNFINSMSLKCVVELGIPDAIHKYGKPMPLAQLICSLQIHPSKTSFVHRLMRILVHSNFFTTKNVTNNDLEVEVGYVLTDSSMLLLKDSPLSLIPHLFMILDPNFIKPWHQMSTWFKNDDPTSFETEYGITFWDYARQAPKFNELFNDAMASDARLVSKFLLDDKCKGVFEGLESLVDVGGGTGTVAKAIAKAFPRLECIVLDLPHVVADLEGSENLKYVGGNMFEAIPPSNAILLKWILHNWNDEECSKILRNCKEALHMSNGEGRKIIVIDIVMGDEKSDHESIETQLFFDMMMMVFLTGKQRNREEWANLIFSAGFSDYKIIPILGIRSLIEIYP
ncbi:trans-resveratrol di-O-methyltransferase-like [Arachis stenosperma]|uniref:trans-resveratrol di-O-methyltransferase-like n=1 Tax=Arachis stenosperma TaxID=217475 RepID=UPI0025ABDF40|nr:trans-resveratrol di-O-methyltransferase-like [Arachis stenosperma]